MPRKCKKGGKAPSLRNNAERSDGASNMQTTNEINTGTRSDTEWNQWVASEKRQLAAVMERHGIEWEQKGTHEKHLSVLDFEKK